MKQSDNAEIGDQAVALAKEHLQKLDLAVGFVVVALYGSKVDVVVKGDIFQVSGMIEIAKNHAMGNFERTTIKS